MTPLFSFDNLLEQLTGWRLYLLFIVKDKTGEQPMEARLFLGFFIEVPLGSHEWLDHWPLVVIKLSLQPLSSPWRSDNGAESSKPLIPKLVPVATSSHPPKSPRQHTKKMFSFFLIEV